MSGYNYLLNFHTNVLHIQVDMTNAALLALIENYCREAGVRNLQKHIEKIYRKVCQSISMKFATTCKIIYELLNGDML